MSAKTAIVTGASRGIGAAIAKALAKEGYNLVLICEKNEQKLDALAKDLNVCYGVEVLTHAGDISNESFVSEVYESTKVIFPNIDVLVNNAGTWAGGLITDISLDTWNRIIGVNLTGTFLMCRAFAPGMISQKSGAIINISSIWGVRGAACETAYSASKGGINAFTVALAKELAPSGITVNAIAPGVIDTDMNKVYSDEEKRELIDSIPASHLGTPEDIARMVTGIINVPYLTGEIITVDGGFL